jgi:hypothetical protein
MAPGKTAFVRLEEGEIYNRHGSTNGEVTTDTLNLINTL